MLHCIYELQSLSCCILPCKVKRQYLLTLQVSRYCLLALQSSHCQTVFSLFWSCNCCRILQHKMTTKHTYIYNNIHFIKLFDWKRVCIAVEEVKWPCFPQYCASCYSTVCGDCASVLEKIIMYFVHFCVIWREQNIMCITIQCVVFCLFLYFLQGIH